MQIQHEVSLRTLTTMKLGGTAKYFATVQSVEDVIEVVTYAHENNLETYVLGGGSNTIVHDEGFDGVVIKNQIMGFEQVDDTHDTTTFRVGAGEDWDQTVLNTVERNLTGIEAMSAIPGTVGASPVQNIGAYGQEVSDVITQIEAYDTQSETMVTLSPEDCQFGYRNSIFRGEAYERYVITSVTMKLWKIPPSPPFYAALQTYLDSQNITQYTPQNIRDAVMAIRFAKLPDPSEFPNSGSFFKNAVIDSWQYNELIKHYPDMPAYTMSDNKQKIPSGWLIEQCGFKGQLLHGIRVHDKNCLVLINESATSHSDLEAARDEIIGAVMDKFRIAITQEPLTLASPPG
jgi:UDP-N-acetylmuramate dehydrogenase